MALKAGNPKAAQLVAAECVVTAETKDHQNWELMAQAAEQMPTPEGKSPESCVWASRGPRRRAFVP